MSTPERLILIGYRGTGKSTVGRTLATALNWPFYDADAIIEAKAGRTIAQIFADETESGFRDRESAVLQELCQYTPAIISTGGGAILRPENRLLLRSAGQIIWLTAPVDVIWERLQTDPTTGARRPNLAGGGRAEVEQLLRTREPWYRECADQILDTAHRSPEALVSDILAEWQSLSR